MIPRNTSLIAIYIGILSLILPASLASAQNVTIVRRDTLSIADDLLKSVIHPSPFSF